MIKDRRKGQERRAVKRYEVSFEVDWEGSSGRHSGALGDISKHGCFVLTSGEIEDGEIVDVYVPISEGMKIQFTGEVVNHVTEIGFGLKFVELNTAQREMLEKIMEAAVGEDPERRE